RQGAEDMKRTGQKMRQLQNQKRVQSQLRDLKDAMSRAKPRKSGTQKSMADRMRQQRIKEWEQRAGGLRGNPQAWRQTGQGKGQEGNRSEGQDPGSRWGTEHDPNLMDDPTRLASAKFENDELKGLKGQG